MIQIDGVHKRLAGEPVLNGVTLHVERGEVVALLGPSGGGKSVLLKHVVGLLVPDHGDVSVDGRSIARARARELARIRLRIGYVFQDAALLDSLTVRDNLRLALDDRVCATEPSHADRRMAEALELVNLEPSVLGRCPPELSGGMRKRVGIARAIINAPAVLLYDEPTTGLDPRNVEAINRLVLAARAQYGATSILITHDLASLEEVADRVVLLLHGRVHFDGSPQEFFTATDEHVRDFIGRVIAIDNNGEMTTWSAIDAAATN